MVNLSSNKSKTEWDEDAVDDGVMAGSIDLFKALDMIRKEHGSAAAEGYAGGAAAGIRNWIAQNMGAGAAELLFTGLVADIDEQQQAAGVLHS